MLWLFAANKVVYIRNSKYASLHGSTFYRGHIHVDTGQYNAADLLPKSITCRFNYLQIHTTRCSGDCWKFSVLISCRFHIIFRSELLSTPSEFGRLMKAAMF